MSRAPAEIAGDLERLARFRAEYPAVMILHKAFRPVAYTIRGPLYGKDLHDLLGKLEEIYPPGDGLTGRRADPPGCLGSRAGGRR